MNRTGVLLINLGTPDAPTPEAVGRYLREFLMDGYVIDLPKPLRWFLVHVMIVPRRKEQSAKAYQKVQLSKDRAKFTCPLRGRQSINESNRRTSHQSRHT